MAKFGKMGEFIVGSSWKTYSQKLAFYFEANGITEDTKKRNVFLTVCGDATFTIADALMKPVQLEEATFADIKVKLDTHFNPAANPIVERFKFNKRDQWANESIADYVADLRKLSDSCIFTDLDDRLRDRIVCGTRDESLKHRFFEEGAKLTFQKALEMALASEVAQKSVRDVRPSSESSILYNKHAMTSKTPEKTKEVSGKCYRCGYMHASDTCRFKSTRCRFCGKIGHLEKVCITKRYSEKRDNPIMKQTGKTNHFVQEESGDESDENENNFLYHHTEFKSKEGRSPPIRISVYIDNQPLVMEIDSGASYSIISEETYHYLWPKKPPLTEENIFLRTWTKQQLSVLGSKEVEVKQGKNRSRLTILVVKGTGPSLLGRDWFEPLNICFSTTNHISNEDILEKYKSLFDGNVGKFKGPPVMINVEKNTAPKFLKSRPVPFALKEKIELELDRQEAAGIIEKVPTSKWATPIVPVLKKNGQIRICGDYAATVNKVIERVVYPLPTANEIFAKLSGCNQFTKIDLEFAYLQLAVDESTADLLTLNTSKGLYRMHRLPFGISSAPAVFQKFMDVLLAGMHGVAALLDDVIIGGSTEIEHWKRVNQVLQRIQNAGLKLNKEKCVFGRKSVTFLGFKVDAEGIHPTEDKVLAIKKAPETRNKKELQAFLGLFNFYERFLARKSTILEPLHRLLDNKGNWQWKSVHAESFQKAKDLIRSDAVLTHYDASKDVVLACDASPYGVGAVLSHVMEGGIEKPVAYGSKTLQPAERNYAQVDREALAVIFGVKKFHQYLAGRKFVIVTDHKPLLGFFHPDKPMPTVISPRMLRWKLMLQYYNYEIKYRPGKYMCNADALSRLPVETTPVVIPYPAEILLLESEIDSPITVKDIAKETQSDTILGKVYSWVSNGWPENCLEIYNPYSRRKDELSIHRNCLLWGTRVIIPQKLRTDVLALLHATHQGIVRTKSIARSYVWWPKLDQAIEDLVRRCEPCQLTRNNPPKEYHPWMKPLKPWSRIHIDFAGPFKNQIFLVVVDVLSNWPEVHIVNSMTSAAAIRVLRGIFSTHGLPDTLVADNGTTFTSEEFRKFMTRNGINLVLTPIYHPPSNGAAERMVQTIKQNLKRLSGSDWHTRVCRMLLGLRTTPGCKNKSPAEIMMNRKLTTLLDRLHPESILTEQKEEKLTKRSVKLNDPVYMRNFRPNLNRKWTPGIVTAVKGAVTYEVTSPEGDIQKRHIDHLIRRYPLDKPPDQEILNDTPIGDSVEATQDSQPIDTVESTVEDLPTSNTGTIVNDELRKYPIVTNQQSPVSLRRSKRIRKRPDHLKDYVLDFGGTNVTY